MKETWRTVSGYRGAYEVSNLGRVRTYRPLGRGKGLNARFRVMSPRHASNGYVKIGLHKNGQRREWWIHRLVAIAFMRDRMKPGLQVDHGDGSKTNNRLDNLEWVTASENHLRRWARKRREAA